LALLCAAPLLARAETQVSGSVEGVWNLDGSPYIATGELSVANDAELAIEPGVEIRFDTANPFFIYGTLSAEGNEDDSILFAPIAGAETWGGVRFLEAESVSILKYCVLRMGLARGGEGEQDSAALGGNVFLWHSDIILEHCRISFGSARLGGGGMAMLQSDPTITNCVINENISEGVGGGIHIAAESSPEISDCQINSNQASSAGGGMSITHGSNPRLTATTFSLNTASVRGGAIFLNLGSSPPVSRCSFIGNTTTTGAAVYIRDEGSSPLFDWCYFYANATTEGDTINRVGGAIYIRAQAAPEIRFCRFVENDAHFGGAIYVKEPPHCNIHHNLFLRNGALRAGGGVATANDLGQIPLQLTSCTFFNNRITGGGVPLATAAYAREGATIVINSSIVWGDGPHFGEAGRVTVIYSNVRGGFPGDGNSYLNPGIFERDSTLFLLRGDSPCVDSGDSTLSADPDSTQRDRGWIYFPHNAWEGLETDTLSAELTTIDRAAVTLRLRNQTDIPFYASPLDQWKPVSSLEPADATAITGDNQLHAVAWTSDGFALAGANNEQNPNKIYLLNGDLSLENSFDQPGDTDEGFLDLATDGESVIYGGSDRYIYEITTDGEEGERYDSPRAVAVQRGLGVDLNYPYRFIDFYIGGDEGLIIRADDEMWERGRVQVGDTIYGLGVKGNTRALYIVTQDPNGTPLLSLVTPDDGKIEPLYRLNPPEGFRIGGFEVTQNWEPGRGSLVGIWESDSSDYLFIDDLYTAWLVIQPECRLLMPGDETEWDIVFAGDQLPAGEYTDNFYLAVNSYGENGEVYTTMNLIQSSVQQPTEPLPQDINLLGVYPNPFNNRARVAFQLGQPGMVSLSLFDLSGRIVSQSAGGLFPSGTHTLQLDASGLPSGCYYLRLTGNEHLGKQIPLVIMK
jgi:hypothetical protein